MKLHFRWQEKDFLKSWEKAHEGNKTLSEHKTASEELKFTRLQLESTLIVPGADELWYHKAQHPSDNF